MRRNSLECWIGLSVLLSASAASRNACAETTPIQVEFESPPECVQQSALAALVKKNLQGVVVSEQRSVRGSASRSVGGYRFQLELRDRGRVVGDRVLDTEGDDCHRGDEPLALVIAMLLEGPDLTEAGSTRNDSSGASSLDQPNREPEDSNAEVEEQHVDVDRSHVALGVLLGVSSQLQPETTLGALVTAAVDLPFRLSLRAWGGYFTPGSHSVSGYGSVEVSQWFAGGELCVSPWSNLGWLGACAGARSIVLPARGVDFPENAAVTAVIGAASVIARALVPWGERWRLGGGLGVVVPWNRASFVGANVLNQTTELHRTGSLAFELSLGAEFLLN